MHRREFLRNSGAFAVAVPALGWLSACNGTDDTADDTGDTAITCTVDADAEGEGTGSGHTHTVTIPQADIESGTGGTYTSSTDSSHDHAVTLSDSEMATLRDTCTVEVTTDDSGHSHTWTISIP